MSNILIIEDEPAVASVIRKALAEEKYEVTVAMDGDSALDFVNRFDYRLLIMDIMLPGINGVQLCRTFRKQGIATPILLLTALSSTDNIVSGLDAGADDYLIKPFKIAELMARVRALLRRNRAQTSPSTGPNALTFADITLNLDEKNATRNNQLIELTPTEFRLLEYLMRNPRRVLSRMDILENVWGYDFEMNTKTVDVYINYLRKKLGTGPDDRLIQTAVGMGYMLKEE
jgi:DNA-binding response OmpR family regulator